MERHRLPRLAGCGVVQRQTAASLRRRSSPISSRCTDLLVKRPDVHSAAVHAHLRHRAWLLIHGGNRHEDVATCSERQGPALIPRTATMTLPNRADRRSTPRPGARTPAPPADVRSGLPFFLDIKEPSVCLCSLRAKIRVNYIISSYAFRVISSDGGIWATNGIW